MFLRYFIELPLPAEAVEQALLPTPTAWMPQLADRAEARGQQLLAQVGIGHGGHALRKRVRVSFGPMVRYPSRTTLPMTWEPDGADAMFPVLDADLEIGALGPARTQLGLNARYRPPLGGIGRVIDRALLHRVAEATIKDFLDQAGQAIQRAADQRRPAETQGG